MSTDEHPATRGTATEYGSAEHAAREALNQSIYASEGWLNAEVDSVAKVVVEGLRERGFRVASEPLCECGWRGEANHYHDSRLGRSGGP